MPKTRICPECNAEHEMTENDDGVWVCKRCGGAFVPFEKHTGPKSIFGVR